MSAYPSRAKSFRIIKRLANGGFEVLSCGISPSQVFRLLDKFTAQFADNLIQYEVES